MVAGLIILITGIFNTGFAIDYTSEWWDRVDMMDDVVPVGYILLAVAMFALAVAYRIASGSAAGSLLVSLAVVVWAIILLEPTSKMGIYSSLIVEGTLALVTMVIVALGLSRVVSKWKGYGSSGPTIGGYVLIILFGIFYLVAAILAIVSLEVDNLDLAIDLARASLGVLGTGYLLGGIAGILLLTAFLVTSARLPSAARRRARRARRR